MALRGRAGGRGKWPAGVTRVTRALAKAFATFRLHFAPSLR